MRDSVPTARYSPVCNVLHQWKTSLIPTYRVYRLYDIFVSMGSPFGPAWRLSGAGRLFFAQVFDQVGERCLVFVGPGRLRVEVEHAVVFFQEARCPAPATAHHTVGVNQEHRPAVRGIFRFLGGGDVVPQGVTVQTGGGCSARWRLENGTDSGPHRRPRRGCRGAPPAAAGCHPARRTCPGRLVLIAHQVTYAAGDPVGVGIVIQQQVGPDLQVGEVGDILILKRATIRPAE